MKDIEIEYKKSESKKDAYKRVKKKITAEMLAKYKIETELIYDDENCSIRGKGNGFDFNLDFYDNEVCGDLNLSFLFKPFKAKVIESLEKKIKKVV